MNDTVYKICLTQMKKEVIKIDEIIFFGRRNGRNLEFIEMIQRFQELLDKLSALVLEHKANCKLFRLRNKQKLQKLNSQVFNKKPLVRCRSNI